MVTCLTIWALIFGRQFDKQPHVQDYLLPGCFTFAFLTGVMVSISLQINALHKPNKQKIAESAVTFNATPRFGIWACLRQSHNQAFYMWPVVCTSVKQHHLYWLFDQQSSWTECVFENYGVIFFIRQLIETHSLLWFHRAQRIPAVLLHIAYYLLRSHLN